MSHPSPKSFRFPITRLGTDKNLDAMISRKSNVRFSKLNNYRVSLLVRLHHVWIRVGSLQLASSYLENPADTLALPRLL
jgi:hypothetical protein